MKKSQYLPLYFTLVLALFFSPSCDVKDQDQDQDQSKSQIDQSGLDLFTLSTPEAEGISSNAIESFIDGAEGQQPDALHSLMIVRHGRIVAQGWWEPYAAESPHLLYSLSKSFVSTAIGLAIQEDLITIDDPLISFFPELTPENPSRNLQSMRIRDLITMNTGHQQDASRRMMEHPEGWVAGFLSLDVEHKPGTIFVYNSGATYMLSAIIQKVTGMPVVEYLQPGLFDPLEISPPTWESDPEGINVGGWGLSVTTLDIAKLGQLYLQKGNWKGRQILSEEWVNSATSLQTSNGSNPASDWDQGYGYQFWRNRYNSYRGDGAFGQYCIVMPEKDAVIAITAASNDMQGILNLVWEHLLPAMQNDALPENEEALSTLNTRLENLALTPVQGEATSTMAPEVTGLKYELASNAYGLEALEFDLSAASAENGENSMSVWTSDGRQTFPIGFNTMLKGRMGLPGQVPWATAASGAWVSEDHYRVLVYNYESPHALTFDFVFDEGGQSMTWDAEYNMAIWSPRKLEQMKGVLEPAVAN